MTQLPSEATPTSESSAPTTVRELLETDPLKLSDQNLDSIVVAARAARREWNIEEEQAKASGKRPKTTKALTDRQLNELKVDDIQI